MRSARRRDACDRRCRRRARVATLLGNNRPGLRADAGAADGRLPARAAQSALYGARAGFHPARRPTRAADRRRGLRPAAPLAAAQGIRLLDGATARAWTIPSDETPAAAPAGDADAPALLQYTGGTTGQPKGVILSRPPSPPMCSSAKPCCPRATAPRPCSAPCRCSIPTAWRWGCSWPPAPPPRGAAALPARRCVRRGARTRHAVPGSPTIYAGLMAHARFTQTDWSSVRVCYSGSAPLAEETLRRWEAAVARRSMKATARPRPAPS